jgi:hypothetical protein
MAIGKQATKIVLGLVHRVVHGNWQTSNKNCFIPVENINGHALKFEFSRRLYKI